MTKFILKAVANNMVVVQSSNTPQLADETAALFVNRFNELMERMENENEILPRFQNIFDLLSAVNKGISDRLHGLHVQFDSDTIAIPAFLVEHNKAKSQGMGVIIGKKNATSKVDFMFQDDAYANRVTDGRFSFVPVQLLGL